MSNFVFCFQTYVRDPNLQDKPQNALQSSASASVTSGPSTSASTGASKASSILNNKENARPVGTSTSLSPPQATSSPLPGGTSGSSGSSAQHKSGFGGTSGSPSSPGPQVTSRVPPRRIVKTASKNIVIPK